MMSLSRDIWKRSVDRNRLKELNDYPYISKINYYLLCIFYSHPKSVSLLCYNKQQNDSGSNARCKAILPHW